MIQKTNLQKYLPAIHALPFQRALTKKDLLTEQFLMEQDGAVTMYYAPHNEYINREATIVILGITPGWKQMKAAYEQMVKSLKVDQNTELALKKAKIAASFAGTMRVNLVRMLDACGLPDVLHINSSASLFAENRELLHTTSIIKYPVFYKGINYTGHQPSIKQSSLLTTYADNVFPKELYQIRKSTLIIPLGKTVERYILSLKADKMLPNHTCLTGFPHPSGANGHRNHQFLKHQNELISTIKEWAVHYNKT